jgi:hypothetical protein
MKKRRIPPMLSDLMQMTLASCDGVLFDQCGACPHCGGELSGYDVKKKQFAIIMEGEQKRAVNVLVKRFLCRQCGQVCLADQPFYPDTRIGSPVVDLCVTLGETMPYARVSSCLAEMGIIVDRWSVRNYIQQNDRTTPAADMFGVRVPLSMVSLSSLAAGIPEGGRMDARALLVACGNPWVKETAAGFPRGI